MNILQEILAFIIKCLPRVVLVYPNEMGVKFFCGRFSKTVEEGLYFLLPLVEDIKKIVVATQIINLPNQSLQSNGKTIAVSGAIEYHIESPFKALCNVLNYDTSLQNLAMSVIANSLYNSLEVDINATDLQNKVYDIIEQKASQWGLCITNFWITDLCEHKVYRIMTTDMPTACIIDQ